MIKATITPSQKLVDAPLFRRASLALDDDPDNPVLDIEWGFGFTRPGLTLTDRATGKPLATTSRKVRGFPPRAHYTLDVAGAPASVPVATLHYRWFNPRLQLGDETFRPQMMRTEDEPFLAFETEHWGYHVVDHETALHLQVARHQLLLPITFTAYFIWTYHTISRG